VTDADAEASGAAHYRTYENSALPLPSLSRDSSAAASLNVTTRIRRDSRITEDGGVADEGRTEGAPSNGRTTEAGALARQ